ncbi:polymorphic toxin-type HINT domain-containing protein [Streptomyces sp. CLV115]|uniref:polymorphic toxin-type HINT domain-containing protein n=1 Tax=Streptomyces sp. CLV115 TaxID=3138502 RepID=UPI00313B9B89
MSAVGAPGPAGPPPPVPPQPPVAAPTLRGRLRALPRRTRILLLSGLAGALVLALLGGLLARQSDPGSAHGTAAAKRHLAPFQEAVRRLAEAPGLRYGDTTTAGISQNQITVTARGSRFGTNGYGKKLKDLEEDVLRIGDKIFTRRQVDPVPPPDAEPGVKKPSRWTLGEEDDDGLLGQALQRAQSPPALAAVLSTALAQLEHEQSLNDPRQQHRSVHGNPALAVDTSAGRLLVTRQKPHRVLRLEPYDLSESIDLLEKGETSTLPEVTNGPLAAHGSEGMDLTPIVSDAEVGDMFDTLVEYAEGLKDATVSGIDFSLDGSGDLNCGASGCSVVQKFTGNVSAKERKDRVADGEVSAVLSAGFTIAGQPAGRCTSPRGTFALHGNDVSGTLKCSSTAAGPVYTATAARYKAKADAESRAAGGRTVRYTIPFTADTLVEARALARVETEQLVKQAKGEREACGSPHSFPDGTQVLLADGTHRAIEDVRPGDRVTATDPQHARTASEPVTRTITTENDKSFTRLTLATPHGPTTLIATDTHPFWTTRPGHWKNAEDIRPGDTLHNPTGAPVMVLSVQQENSSRRTHDLTVGELHTYYVLAGQTPILVHNSNGSCGIGRELIGDERSDHILDGHRYPGAAGKDPFPKKWSDDQILDAVADVVTSPNSRRTWYKGSAVHAERTLKTRKGVPAVQNVIGTVGGVRILVRYEPLTGKVLTAFPD